MEAATTPCPIPTRTKPAYGTRFGTIEHSLRGVAFDSTARRTRLGTLVAARFGTITALCRVSGLSYETVKRAMEYKPKRKPSTRVREAFEAAFGMSYEKITEPVDVIVKVRAANGD